MKHFLLVQLLFYTSKPLLSSVIGLLLSLSASFSQLLDTCWWHGADTENAGHSRLIFLHRQERGAFRPHRRKGDESFLHPRLPYAKCITHHVCVTLTPTARRLHTLKRPCFHTCTTFPGICVHLSACVVLSVGIAIMCKQTYVHTCSLCLHQHQRSCEGVCPCEFDSSHQVERTLSASLSKTVTWLRSHPQAALLNGKQLSQAPLHSNHLKTRRNQWLVSHSLIESLIPGKFPSSLQSIPQHWNNCILGNDKYWIHHLTECKLQWNYALNEKCVKWQIAVGADA